MFGLHFVIYGLSNMTILFFLRLKLLFIWCAVAEFIFAI